MKTIYESDEIIVAQENDATYHMQINNQDKVANDANTLSSAINAIRNAVWALDVYSNKKIQLIITIVGSTPNAIIMQNTQNNSQLKNFTILNLDIIVSYSFTQLAPKIFNKAIVSAGIGTMLGTIIPGIGNVTGAGSGFIAGAGRVLFLAGIGYFSTTILSNIYDTLEIDALYDYLKDNIFKLKDKYEQDTLRNPNEMELRAVLESLDSNSTAKDIDSLLHSFPHYLKKESKQEVYTPLSPQGISFPYSSIIYLTTIKALKDTLKEYLPKAKKIVLYTPNPFVSLYTSSPFYIFNSNLSFFNPHLQYLLTSKDTQQWLYDTLFNLARDNREIIVYEWGGSIGDLDSKESQANKKDLDSKDTNQSTNTQKQTKTYYLSPQGQKLKEKQPYCIRVIAKESKVFTILRDFITSFNTTKEQEVFRALEILLKDKESLEHLRQCIIKSLKEPIIESIYSLKETKDLNKEELKENVEEVFNNLLGVA